MTEEAPGGRGWSWYVADRAGARLGRGWVCSESDLIAVQNLIRLHDPLLMVLGTLRKYAYARAVDHGETDIDAEARVLLDFLCQGAR